jgi:hypothetical protein
MPEKLIDICQSISDSKKNLSMQSNSVVARYHTTFDNKPTTMWIYIYPQNTRTPISIEGNLVYRNSIAGNTLINRNLGEEWNYSNFNYLRRRVEHLGITHNRAIYENKTIEIENIAEIFKYEDINDFLFRLKENSEEIVRNEQLKENLQEKYRIIEESGKSKEASIEKARITIEIKKIDEKLRIVQMQQEEMKDLTRFIRKQGELRFNPILDPIQNKIKTNHLYDGVTVVINGGPGTGKTTTMIQRLKYLIDEFAITEDSKVNNEKKFNLSDFQRVKLFELSKDHKDWIFFSPSQLLKQYLSNAMNKEGLTNTNTKVQNWDDYRRKMMMEYDFFNPASPDEAPFKNCKNDLLIFNENSNPINDLNQFFFSQLQNISNKFPKIINKNKYGWYSLAINIENSFKSKKLIDLSDFIMLFNNLERNFGVESAGLLEENRRLISEIATLIHARINDTAIRKNFEELVSNEINQSIEETQDISDDFIQDDENEDEDRTVVSEMTTLVNKSIRLWLKRYCMNQLEPTVKLSERQIKIRELIQDILKELNVKQINRIGELALFESYAKYTSGIQRNILSGLSAKYKSFRRSILKNCNEDWNLVLLEKLVNSSKGKELHKQEQSLLLGYTNNLVKEIKRVTPTYKLKNKYNDLYEMYSRPIIGIDEATDFSLVDIYAMLSFTYIDFYSVTICGDVMQRLTSFGIQSWDKLNMLIPNKEIVNMNKSYRQSVLLLDVAKEIYKDTIGHMPDYKAYMKSTKVPKPLSYISQNENDKIFWIEQRIIEVYKAYDNKLPSIAIFLNDNSDIPEFVNSLRECDFFENSGIKVIDGSSGIVLADINDVRVYPIDVVKGMEFDVVFFHNIDNGHFTEEIAKRYIYVGLSRAAFFLAITSKRSNENLMKYFVNDSDWSKII